MTTNSCVTYIFNQGLIPITLDESVFYEDLVCDPSIIIRETQYGIAVDIYNNINFDDGFTIMNTKEFMQDEDQRCSQFLSLIKGKLWKKEQS